MKYINFLKLGILILAVETLCLGCKTTVDLTVTNPTSIPQQVAVIVKTPSGNQESQIEMGVIATNKQASTKFPVRHGGQFSLNASVPGSTQFDTQSRTITGSENDPDDISMELKPPSNLLQPEKAAAQIEGAMSQLGAYVGFNPIPVQNGLDTIFGALVVIPKPTDKPSQTYLFKLTPGQFSPKIALTDFRYPDDTISSTMEIDGSTSASVGANVPMYGSLSLSSSSSSVYKINYNLNNFGMVEKADPTNWTYSIGLQNLKPEDKAQLYSTLRNNPGSMLLYINKIYVVGQAIFGVSEAEKLDVSAKFDAASSVVTANGAYSFAKSGEKNTTFNNTIVNIGGIQIYLDVATITATNTISTTAINATGVSLSEAIKTGDARLIPSKVTETIGSTFSHIRFDR